MIKSLSIWGRDASLASVGSPAISVVGALVTVATLVFAVVAASSIALIGPVAGLAIVLLLVGAGFLFFPRASVWAVSFGGLAVVGLVELYLPELQAIRWAFSVWSVCLAFISVVHWIGHKERALSWEAGAAGLSIALGLFVLSVVLATVVGRIGLGNATVGVKNYFQMWGLLLALAMLGYQPVDARRFMVFMGWLALIQLPFVLHQYIVLVPQRSGVTDAARNIVAVDIVAGTFGGNMVGGGRSSDLATLSIMAISLFLAQWKLGYRGLRSTLLFSAVAFLPMMLNEAKLALVLLPLALWVLFCHALLRRPLQAVMGTALLGGLLALVVVAYSQLPGAEGQKSKTVSDFIESSVAYNVGEKGYGSAVLNRSSVYSFWWSEHLKDGAVLPALLGHGPGFSNSTAIAKGENPASARYRGYAIGLTGLSSLLWDTGVLGAGLFVLVLCMAYRLAARLSHSWQGTEHEPVLEASKVAVVLLGMNLLHNDFVSFDIGFQTMVALVLGYLFAMARQSGGNLQ